MLVPFDQAFNYQQGQPVSQSVILSQPVSQFASQLVIHSLVYSFRFNFPKKKKLLFNFSQFSIVCCLLPSLKEHMCKFRLINLFNFLNRNLLGVGCVKLVCF